MIRFSASASAALLAALLAATQSAARPALRDVPEIREGLIAVGTALEIGTHCSDLSPRYLRGLAYLQRLRDTARDLGYTEAEIDAYVDDGAERARLEAEARARLAARGAVPGREAGYCAAGREEIASGSVIGHLLR